MLCRCCDVVFDGLAPDVSMLVGILVLAMASFYNPRGLADLATWFLGNSVLLVCSTPPVGPPALGPAAARWCVMVRMSLAKAGNTRIWDWRYRQSPDAVNHPCSMPPVQWNNVGKWWFPSRPYCPAIAGRDETHIFHLDGQPRTQCPGGGTWALLSRRF